MKNQMFPPEHLEQVISLLVNVVLKVLTSATRKINKRHTDLKGINKILFREYDCLYRKSQAIRISEFSKAAGYEVNIQKNGISIHCNEQLKIKILKQYLL